MTGSTRACSNLHSGAESNVVGGQALLDHVTSTAPQLAPLVETCFVPDVRERLSGAQRVAAR